MIRKFNFFLQLLKGAGFEGQFLNIKSERLLFLFTKCEHVF